MEEPPGVNPADTEALIDDREYHLYCLQLVNNLSTDHELTLLSATVHFGEQYGRVWRGRFKQDGRDGSVMVRAMCWNDNGNTAVDVSILPMTAPGEK